MSKPIQVAIAGLGGFARSHHAAIRALEAEGVCRLVATCDPFPETVRQGIEAFDLESRGVRVYESLAQLLAAHDVDMVTLPTPIPLHAEQHRQVVEAGVACYLEKPPTLCPQEFEEMCAVEAGAKWQTNVGFNFVGDPFRRALKARILSGEFGRILRVRLLALWQRDADYYARSPWAGRNTLDGRPVFDSPIGNATAHFVQDLLFWCGGPSVDSIASVGAVQSRLFRRPSIESFDTVFAAATVGDGIGLRLGVTHSGVDNRDCETIECERATITFPSWREALIHFVDGSSESLCSSFIDYHGVHKANFAAYMGYLWSEVSRPITRLEDCRSFVTLLSRVREASPIVEFAAEPPVEGLDEQIVRFLETGAWPD